MQWVKRKGEGEGIFDFSPLASEIRRTGVQVASARSSDWCAQAGVRRHRELCVLAFDGALLSRTLDWLALLLNDFTELLGDD